MTKPNIIFILSDQHRYDWMGCAGNEFVSTPSLDRLAETGVRFANNCCNSPLCGPSRMSMLTGQHQYRNGVYINEHCLSSDVPTFAHALGLGGYQTVLCGRMHFMGPDQRHGFEERLVGDVCRCYPGGPRTDYTGMEGSASSAKKAIAHAGPKDSPVLQFDRMVTDGFEEFIDGRNDERPLFTVIGYYGPHHPYCAPQEFYEEARDRMKEKDAPIPSPEAYHPWFDWRLEKSEEHLTPLEKVREVRANYAGMISYLDTLISRLLTASEQLKGETLVIYTSDHGEAAGDRGLFNKCAFYETSLKVPLVISPLRNSGHSAEPGTVIDYNTSLVDLAPTLTEIADAPALPLQDGESLAPFLRGDTADDAFWRERPIFSELEILRQPPKRMILKGKLKLIYYHTFDRHEMYDLESDPEELKNVAGDPAYADRKEALLKELLKDWNPDVLMADVHRKMDNLNYMAQWGRTVGVTHLGKMDLWDQPGIEDGKAPLS